MFRKAIALAQHFTKPVVISQRNHAGACSSMIGAFIVINPDGWIITAGHLHEALDRGFAAVKAARDLAAKRAAIEADPQLMVKEKRKALAKVGHPSADQVVRQAVWWAHDKARLVDSRRLKAADIAVGRLEPFIPDTGAVYPKFRRAGAAFEPGASLCRLGFPFHGFAAVWDDGRQLFMFPPGALPIPFFPLEGMATREVELQSVDASGNVIAPPFPMREIETSSPGLRGQSGGPIFDSDGTVWGVQSSTAHYPLGFSPPVPGSKTNELEHQFLNVGRGVHADTIAGMLSNLGVTFQTA